MIIRKITSGDAVGVARLLAASPGAAPWSPLDGPAPPNTEALVAEHNGEVVGIIVTQVSADEAEVLNLAVLPDLRRRGVACELLSAALAAARTLAATRVFLEVRESNQAARAFYSRMGFVASARRRAYYRDPVEDALILTLIFD